MSQRQKSFEFTPGGKCSAQVSPEKPASEHELRMRDVRLIVDIFGPLMDDMADVAFRNLELLTVGSQEVRNETK